MPSMGLAIGAGAGNGLNEVLTRMMEEAKLKQLTDSTTARQAEENRSNVAHEGLQRDQIAATERQRVATMDATKVERDRAEGRAVRDDSRQAMDTIPSGTVMPETDPQVRMADQAGFGSLLRGVKSRPSVDVGPLQEEDQGQAIPVDSRIKLKSFAQQKEADKEGKTGGYNNEVKTVLYHGKPVDAIFDPRAKTFTHPNGTDITKDVGDHYVAPDRTLVQSGDQWVRRPDAAGKPIGDPAQVRNRRDMATAVGSHFDDASQLIDEADAKGLLGPMKGRTFAEFLAGKMGSTGNAENDALLGDLRTSMSMIRSGTASLHGRAGANAGIAKEIQSKMDEGFMDPAMLKGSLKSLKSWVDKYASGGSGKTPEAPAVSDAYDEYLKRQKK